MKTNRLILIAAIPLGAYLFSSCSMDPYEITAKEEYTREFIKQFGLIDDGHTFNLAQQVTVTVSASSPVDLKIYGTVDGTRYLFGTFLNVNGTRKLSVDVPVGVSDLYLRTKGKNYSFKPGESVNLAQPASRSLATGATKGVTVTLLPEEREDGGVNYLTIPADEIKNFSMVLPENGEGSHTSPSDTNLGKEGVTENFVAKASSFWIFPEYWNTSQHSANTIGIYYYTDESTPDAEKVIDCYGNASYLVKVPIYTPDGSKNSIVDNLFYVPSSFMNSVNKTWDNFITEHNFIDILLKYQEENKLPEGWEVAVSDGSDKFKQNDWGEPIESGVSVIKLPNDTHFKNLSSINLYDPSINQVIFPIIKEEYPKYYFSLEGNYGSDDWTAELKYIAPSDLIGAELTKATGQESSNYNDVAYYKSKSVLISFDDLEQHTFGFYIITAGHTKYSEAKFNETLTYNDGADSMQAAYVCTFKQGTDTYGNPLRRLCFEDWYNGAETDENGKPGSWAFGSDTNFDMNDMVFRIYGFDEMPNHPDVPPGDIEDHDDPEPESYTWLLACEDLGTTDDFDFNDVVLRISNPVTAYSDDDTGAETTIQVKALAAGGTLPIYIRFNGSELKINGNMLEKVTEEGSEYHGWFDDGNIPYSTMINTGRYTATGNTYTMEVPLGFTLTPGEHGTNMGGFSVRVIGIDGERIDIVAPTTEANLVAPQMICLPGDWAWPTERQNITSKYSGFNQWVTDKNTADWWK